MDAGDMMSAIQLRGQSQQQEKEQQHERSNDNYWDLIPADDPADYMPYAKAGSNMPKCLQGIFYMDQQCLTWPKMKPADVAKPCLGRTNPWAWYNEYLVVMDDWDERKKCFTATRQSWVFGDAGT